VAIIIDDANTVFCRLELKATTSTTEGK